jgi:hypothetical protein
MAKKNANPNMATAKKTGPDMTTGKKTAAYPGAKGAQRGGGMKTAEDPKRLIATIGIQADGDVAWVDYEDGDYVLNPIIDFSTGKEIVFAEFDLKSLYNVTTYALLQLRKTDGTPYACYVKTPRWW